MTDTDVPEWQREYPETAYVQLGMPGWTDEYVEGCYTVAYRRADLPPTREQIAAMVPDLVWLDSGFSQDADFIDTTHTYQIQEGLFWYAAEVDGVPCGSNEKAKAAAQADYTRRILATLLPEGEK